MPKRLKRRTVDVPLAIESALLGKLYAGRGIRSTDELDCSLSKLLSPTLMKGLPEAGELLADCISRQAMILIIGDFDADGATSSALMVDGLRAMGALHVDYLVPNRFEFGYGLSPEIVEIAATAGPDGSRPDLIITVDNGIANIDGVARAKVLGMQVLITDHHLPGDGLPAADAIVNPNQVGCEFPSKAIAGVGVAFYLLLMLRQVLRNRNWFKLHKRDETNLADFLDLVALGTIADVVALDQNNRILVSEGLRRIRGGHCRPGMLALIEQAGMRAEALVSRDLAFGLGPRLNAAGRLEDMTLGIECLLAKDPGEARRQARYLDDLNKARREIENDMRADAQSSLKLNDNITNDKHRTGVCLFAEDWHQGVVGIVASRIKEQLHRPVIAFAKSSDTQIKGSARSIRGLHIRDALAAIDAKQPGLIEKFGGHAMAAGLTLALADYETFARLFDDEARRVLTADDLEEVVLSDGELDIHELGRVDLALVRLIRTAMPWGQGFAEPMFDNEFEVLEQRIVGLRHLKLKLALGPQSFDAIAFNQDRLLESRFQRMAYRLDINEWRGRESVQLIVEAVGLGAPVNV